MKIEKKFRIAILASGNGTNAEAIIAYFARHADIETVIILTNNPKAYVLERALRLKVKSRVFNRSQFPDEVLSWLSNERITHVVLAGFLWHLPQPFIKGFPGRIVNIHPALLPRYGGKGMYGMRVHEEVKAAGDTETGVTIHLVNEEYDMGRILFQERCGVQPNDTPEQIADKVHAIEHKAYPRVIEAWLYERLGQQPGA